MRPCEWTCRCPLARMIPAPETSESRRHPRRPRRPKPDATPFSRRLPRHGHPWPRARRAAAPPPRTAASLLRVAQKRSLHELRERLAAADYREVINFTFVEPQWELDFAGEANPIRLLNPIVSQQSVMRSSLIGSLVANLRYNQARKVERIRVFEVGRVFIRDPQAKDGPLAVRGLQQPMRIGAAAYGPAVEEQWGAET